MKKFFIISLIFVSVIFVARTSVFAQENPAFRQIASILFQISELIQDIAEEVKEIIKSEPTITPTPAPTPQPTPPKEETKPDCDPNYTPCIPNVSYDLDCGDISISVRVIGTDRHRFDRDGDGYGCESN